jgi:hypothetical protein
MSKKSAGARARQIAGILALCTAAVPSFADPVSVTAVCHLRSLLPDEGQCDLFYQVSDSFASPGSARLGQVRVDGKLVAQFVNDTANPVDFAIPLISGTVTVACAASHTVAARFAPLGDPASAYVNAGQMPAIRCPTAQ